MKKLIFLWVSIFHGGIAFAQYPEFAPVGATWYYTGQTMSNDLFTATITSISADTFLNKPCKLFDSDWTSGFYAYRDSLQIYMATDDDSTWHLIYDFSKNMNDTFYIHTYNDIDSMPLKVLSNGDTIINGYQLPYQVLESLDPFWSFNGKAILNIGSEYYFFSPGGTDFPINGLRCYVDDILGEYHVVAPCDTTIVGIEPSLLVDSLFVFPNPFHDQINIKQSRADPIIEVFIFNSIGQLFEQKKLTASRREINGVMIETDLWPIGLYNIVLRTSDKFYSIKIIKQ